MLQSLLLSRWVWAPVHGQTQACSLMLGDAMLSFPSLVSWDCNFQALTKHGLPAEPEQLRRCKAIWQASLNQSSCTGVHGRASGRQASRPSLCKAACFCHHNKPTTPAHEHAACPATRMPRQQAGRQGAVRSGLCRKSRWGRGLQAMAWLGPDLVVCTALRAMLLRLASGQYTPLFALPSDAPTPLLVAPIPQARLALLVVVSPRPFCWISPAIPRLGLDVSAFGRPLTFLVAPLSHAGPACRGEPSLARPLCCCVGPGPCRQPPTRGWSFCMWLPHALPHGCLCPKPSGRCS